MDEQSPEIIQQGTQTSQESMENVLGITEAERLDIKDDIKYASTQDSLCQENAVDVEIKPVLMNIDNNSEYSNFNVMSLTDMHSIDTSSKVLFQECSSVNMNISNELPILSNNVLPSSSFSETIDTAMYIKNDNVEIEESKRRHTLIENELNIVHQRPIINSIESSTMPKNLRNNVVINTFGNASDTTVDLVTGPNIQNESVMGETNKTTEPTNLREYTKKENLEGHEINSYVNSAHNITKHSNSTSRPTLADDSRLVKISLPANPMNIVQSNTQFLNKSRNFFNFITEKSTNIMERALLPQHLAIRYNSALKSTDAGYTSEKKCTNECNFSNKSSITNLEADAIPNSNIKDETYDLECEDQSLSSKFMNINKAHGDTRDADKFSTDVSDAPITERPEASDSHKLKDFGFEITSDTITVQPLNQVDNSQVEFQEDSNSLNLRGFNEKIEQHPMYCTLMKNYTDLKRDSMRLFEQWRITEERNKVLEAEKNGEKFTNEIKDLEHTIDKLTFELRNIVGAHETLKREYAGANKEKESMVMKYAASEKQLIDTQRAREYAERKVKDITKEQELLQNKLRQVQGERTRICNILDGKCREVADFQKEIEKHKEEVNIRDVKLKWTQTKLKSEMELQKETQQKLDKALGKINDMKEECEQVRRDTQESIRKFQQSEENKAVTLDHQLKEQQARLILERHVTEDKELLRLQLQKEVEVLSNRQQVLIEENNSLTLKIQDAEKQQLNYEKTLSSLKIVAEQRQKEIDVLLGKVSQLEQIKQDLHDKEECLKTAEEKIEESKSVIKDLEQDLDIYCQREAELLDFTQKLTEQNVRLQSEFKDLEAKTKQLETEHGPLRQHINELISKIRTLEQNLKDEQMKRREESEILARHVAEQTQLAQNLSQKLEDSQGEITVLRRKQQVTMKALARELQQCRKRLETFEAASPSNSLNITSRTPSNTSLNTGDTLNDASSDNSTSSDHTIQCLEPNKEALIDRILKLQKMNVKRAEKLDFLEGHTRTLVEELQKKTKIIQNYILHKNFGAMGNNERERHKAELAKHGGIMASVYSQKVSDEHMTLELSLEINQKLQAVLEDTLLKNITLKDNIDTLGEEIAKLTMENQQRQVVS